MAKSEAEIKRLEKRVRDISDIIDALEDRTDRASQEELRRQKQLRAGIEAELEDA